MNRTLAGCKLCVRRIAGQVEVILCVANEGAAAEWVYAARPGQRGHPDGSRSGPNQRLGGGAGRCAGGEDVVDEQNVFHGDGSRIGDREGSAHIQAPLAEREAGLALGGAQAHERAGGQREPPLGVGLAQKTQRVDGQRPRLVEAALGILRPVQRHGNHQHLGRRFGSQLGDGLGQHPAQPAGGGMQPVVLERVDGRLHAVLVRSVGHRPHKRRRREPAGSAQRQWPD